MQLIDEQLSSLEKKSVCPGVYAYAYDDGMGLAQCPAGTVYDVTFYCPAGQE